MPGRSGHIQHRCNFFFKQFQLILVASMRRRSHMYEGLATSSSEPHPWRKSYVWWGGDGFIVCGLNLEMITEHAGRTLCMQMFSQVSICFQNQKGPLPLFIFKESVPGPSQSILFNSVNLSMSVKTDGLTRGPSMQRDITLQFITETGRRQERRWFAP